MKKKHNNERICHISGVRMADSGLTGVIMKKQKLTLRPIAIFPSLIAMFTSSVSDTKCRKKNQCFRISVEIASTGDIKRTGYIVERLI